MLGGLKQVGLWPLLKLVGQGVGLKLVGMRRYEGQYGDGCYIWIELNS